MLGDFFRWIWRAGLLCLAVGGFVPLAAPPKKTALVTNARTRAHRNGARWGARVLPPPPPQKHIQGKGRPASAKRASEWLCE
jgi:hypothetical protein